MWSQASDGNSASTTPLGSRLQARVNSLVQAEDCAAREIVSHTDPISHNPRTTTKRPLYGSIHSRPLDINGVQISSESSLLSDATQNPDFFDSLMVWPENGFTSSSTTDPEKILAEENDLCDWLLSQGLEFQR
ncbi:hypothetical protein CBS101457_004907 [Exobasidium rhododendri]|nr:hypothetical protein CBS101457_004907 [Exobasidium rhododendri]